LENAILFVHDPESEKTIAEAAPKQSLVCEEDLSDLLVDVCGILLPKRIKSVKNETENNNTTNERSNKFRCVGF
jgi:hypothetical protein